MDLAEIFVPSGRIYYVVNTNKTKFSDDHVSNYSCLNQFFNGPGSNIVEFEPGFFDLADIFSPPGRIYYVVNTNKNTF